MRKRRGFTLAELLLVVAIIGVLAAVAVPVFTSSLEKARKSVCVANQTSAQHILTYEELFGMKIEKSNWKKIVEASMGDILKLCPSDGEYEYDAESGAVSCPKHREGSVALIGREPEKILGLVKVDEFFYENGKRRPGKKQLDSTGPNFGTESRAQIRTALGLKDDDFDFRVYWEENSQEPKIYVFHQIMLKDAGQTRSVTGYLLHKNAAGHWEVKQTVQGEGTVRKASVEGTDYAQMKVDEIKW